MTMSQEASSPSETKKRKSLSKLGRRGDPRMHRAVAARVANPELPLVEALRMGGFDYPVSGGDDPSVVDSDNVTLGQRKNQLSRRLRLTRQSVAAQMSNGDTGSQDGDNRGRRRSSVNRRSSKTLSSEAQAEYQKLLQHTSQSLGAGNKGVKRNASALSGDEGGTAADGEDADMSDEMQNAASRMAKFHPNYHPLFIPQPRATAAVAGTPWSSAIEHAAAATAQQNNGPAAAGIWSLAQSQQQGQAQNQQIGGAVGGGMNPAALAATAPFNMFSQGLATTPNAQHQPSGVAVASLNATAAAAGMTLEQLAVALSSTPTLAVVLRSQANPEIKQELALNLYKNENFALYKRCMHMSGYEAAEIDERHPSYRAFVIKAWQREGKRLEHIHSAPSDLALDRESSEKASAPSEPHHNHDHSHESSSATDSTSGCFDGRHVHTLEGKCGHRAIIHQPEDGPAHVDFLVDGKVECYQGIRPVGTSNAFWRSRFKCNQIACDEADSHQAVTCGKESCEKECTILDGQDPKVFQLSDINLDGKEWNSNIFDTSSGQIDETLLGLIRLGDSSDDV